MQSAKKYKTQNNTTNKRSRSKQHSGTEKGRRNDAGTGHRNGPETEQNSRTENGWSRRSESGFNNSSASSWNRDTDNGWNRDTDNGWNRDTDNSWNRDTDNGWNYGLHNGWNADNGWNREMEFAQNNNQAANPWGLGCPASFYNQPRGGGGGGYRIPAWDWKVFQPGGVNRGGSSSSRGPPPKPSQFSWRPQQQQQAPTQPRLGEAELKKLGKEEESQLTKNFVWYGTGESVTYVRYRIS